MKSRVWAFLRVGLVAAVLSSAAQGMGPRQEPFKIPWESDKNGGGVSIVEAPAPLEHWLLQIPAGQEEADIDRKAGHKPSSAVVRHVADFHGRSILQVTLKVDGSYYNWYYLILAELQEGRYLPIFIRQTAEGMWKVSERVTNSTDENLEIEVSSRVNGTSPGTTLHRLQLNEKLSFKFAVEDH